MLHARVAGRSVFTALAIFVCLLAPRPSYSGSGAPLVPPVVVWSFDDNVSACPAGDSVFAGHPARLRVQVNYNNSSGQPRNGVPPESIWVEVWTNTGNIVVNDQTLSQLDKTQVFADDSTRVNGGTLITVPSFSGCGTLNVRLYVSGVNQGTRVATIRTTDTNADGRTTSSDQTGACDLNYDNVANDGATVGQHVDHWHRNALHGTLVRRTNYCETCPDEAVNTKGRGQVFWSPSGRFISHTAFVDASPFPPSCKVFIGTSSPAEGNTLLQFTSDPIWYHDYDPSWSPLNTEIAFDRHDSVVVRKPLPWIGGPEVTVTASNNTNCGSRGDDIPAISPDGQWVAFSRCNAAPPAGPGGWSVWKVPITGGAATQLTSAAPRVDFYASWSPDGQTIYFQRVDSTIGPQWTLWKVPATGGTATQIFVPPLSPLDTFDVVQPTSSPDGAILTVGYGLRDRLVRNVVTHTLDASLGIVTSGDLIKNYPDTTFADKGELPILAPRLSPDGTRLALGSKQVWAARRNMNLPPGFTTVTSFEEGTRSIADTAATMNFTFDPHSPNFITVLSTDPESDALTYKASFLQSWMSWSPATRTLTATNPIPPSNIGKTFYVKFWTTTGSGGTDAFIAIIRVGATIAGAARATREIGTATEGPNPTRAAFSVGLPAGIHGGVRLSILDVAGRTVAIVAEPRDQELVWDGRRTDGSFAGPGIYLWRLEAGGDRREGKVVVVR